MLRNRHRKNTAAASFRIRNNFRRLSTLDYVLSQEKVSSDNNNNKMSLDETILQEDSDDNEVMSQILGQRSLESEEDYNEILPESEIGYGDDVNYEESEYDYTALSENEVEHDSDYYEEREYDYTSSSESEEENDAKILPEIVDEALDENKLPFFNGVFAPYFQDFTTAALFCWIHKHNVSTNAYRDLVDIIMKPEFNKNHIVKNIRRFRTWRQNLPLLPISAKSIQISSKNTPSTSKDTKMSYQISITDIIWYTLNNPSLFNNMYFGPGINTEKKTEYWHGSLWAESPLFGQEKLIISGGNNIHLTYS